MKNFTITDPKNKNTQLQNIFTTNKSVGERAGSTEKFVVTTDYHKISNRLI